MFKRGEVVTLQSRKGPVDCVVAAVRFIQRGRMAGQCEYTLAPIGERARNGFYKLKGERWLKPCTKVYDAFDIEAALNDQADTADRIDTGKRKRAERGRDAIGDPKLPAGGWGPLSGSNIAVGDTVLIRGSGCPNWTATVGKLNFRTGKVGILRPEESELASMFRAVRGQRRREYRWVHPDCIIKVMQPERELPFKLSDAHLEKLTSVGWVQATFGREFIEQSYVVGTSPELARKGRNYECASDTVYLDRGLGLYWRTTGSFD